MLIALSYPLIVRLSSFFFLLQGNYFLFIEMTSQLHRSLVPIQVWLLYLLQGGLTLSAGAVERASVESSPYTTYFSTFMGIILMVAYVVVKGKLIYAHFTSWRLAASKLWQCTVGIYH